MMIDRRTSLSKLAREMGGASCEVEAKKMLALLIANGFERIDTAHVPRKEWHELLDEAESK